MLCVGRARAAVPRPACRAGFGAGLAGRTATSRAGTAPRGRSRLPSASKARRARSSPVRRGRADGRRIRPRCASSRRRPTRRHAPDDTAQRGTVSCRRPQPHTPTRGQALIGAAASGPNAKASASPKSACSGCSRSRISVGDLLGVHPGALKAARRRGAPTLHTNPNSRSTRFWVTHLAFAFGPGSRRADQGLTPGRCVRLRPPDAPSPLCRVVGRVALSRAPARRGTAGADAPAAARPRRTGDDRARRAFDADGRRERARGAVPALLVAVSSRKPRSGRTRTRHAGRGTATSGTPPRKALLSRVPE